jgi:hypothetical protein
MGGISRVDIKEVSRHSSWNPYYDGFNELRNFDKVPFTMPSDNTQIIWTVLFEYARYVDNNPTEVGEQIYTGEEEESPWWSPW